MESTTHFGRADLTWSLCVDISGNARRGLVLFREGPEESLLRLATGEFVVLRDYREQDDPAAARLTARMATLREAARGSLILVVLGDPPPIPGGPLLSKLTVFFLSSEGVLRRDGISPLLAAEPTLQAAVARLRSEGGPRALTAEQRAQLVQAGDALKGSYDEEEARFWTKLRAVRPWGTYALVGACVFVFLLESAFGGSEFTPTLYRMGADAPGAVQSGEYFRLLAAAFLHIGPIHLAANMWALVVFGDFLERALGTARFLVLYTVAAFAGSLSSVFLSSAAVSAGASGALWGLMVGGFALSFWGPFPDGLRARIRARGWQPILVNLLISFTPGIALSAHLGGGVAGGFLVLLASRFGLDPKGSNRLAAGAAVCCGLLLVGSVAAALWVGRPWELRGPTGWRSVTLPGTASGLDLPMGLGELTAREKGTWSLGSFPRDPIQIYLGLDQGEGWSTGSLVSALAKQDGPEGMNPTGDAQAVPGNPPLASRTYRHQSGASDTAWLVLKDGTLLRVDVLGLPGAAPAWREVGERVARSFKERPRP